MEINKFNQTMKYLTRPAERPARILSDDPIETPPVFKTSDPKEAIKEVIRRTEGPVPGIGIAPGVSLNPLGTVEDQDPSLTGRFGVGGGELEFDVKEDEGFIGFRKEFKRGGRTVMRPTKEGYKESIQEIKDFVAAKKAAGEEIFHEDLLKLTGKKKVSENFYRLKAAGVLKDITKLGQERKGPVQKKAQKLVDELVDDVYTGKRPIIDLKKEFANKEISEKAGLKKVSKRGFGKYFNTNKKYKEMMNKKIKGNSVVNSITQSIAKQEGELKKTLEKITYPNAKRAVDMILQARPKLPQPRGVEESILRDLRRYAVSNKNKGSLFQITKDSKSYNQLKLFDAEAGETLDKGKIIKYIKQNDPRFQEYVQTFKDVRKIKSKRYGDGTLNDALKKIKRGGVDASVQLGHVDGVAVNPLRNLEPQLAFANQAARAKGIDFKKLGLQAPGGEGGIPRRLTAEENITRFIKFADRTLKTPKPGTKLYSGLAALPEMGRIGKEMITQDVPKFGKFAGQVAKGVGKIALKAPRALVGPVELPVSIAAGGLYANYQNQLDFAKALDRTNLSENQKNNFKNQFRRAELGLDVGVGEEILVDTMGTESDIIGGIKDPDKIGQYQKIAFDAINAERAVQAEKLEQQRKEAQTIEFDEDFDVL